MLQLMYLTLGFNPFTTVNFLIALAVIIGAVILISGVVFVQEAERKIPVQYAKSCRKKNVWRTKHSHSNETCNGWCYANNICFIIYDISCNVNTNILTIINW